MAETQPTNVMELKGQIAPSFFGPPLKDQVVKTTAELINKTTYNYLHKIVWVMSERSWYYLWNLDADPVDMSCWRKVTTQASIPAYNDVTAYFVGETVYYGFETTYKGETKYRYKIYTCLSPTEPGQSPVTHPDKWLCLSDDTLGIRLEFENVSQFIVDTQDIIIPALQVYIKPTEPDQFGEEQETENYIRIEPKIEFIEKSGNYRISFFEEDQYVPKTGFVYIK